MKKLACDFGAASPCWPDRSCIDAFPDHTLETCLLTASVDFFLLNASLSSENRTRVRGNYFYISTDLRFYVVMISSRFHECQMQWITETHPWISHGICRSLRGVPHVVALIQRQLQKMSLDSEIDANEKPKRLVQERTQVQVMTCSHLTVYQGPKCRRAPGFHHRQWAT